MIERILLRNSNYTFAFGFHPEWNVFFEIWKIGGPTHEQDHPLVDVNDRYGVCSWNGGRLTGNPFLDKRLAALQQIWNRREQQGEGHLQITNQDILEVGLILGFSRQVLQAALQKWHPEL